MSESFLVIASNKHIMDIIKKKHTAMVGREAKESEVMKALGIANVEALLEKGVLAATNNRR